MKQFVHVIPLLRSIRGKDRFTYTTEQRYPIGAVVWIPWRTGKRLGVVIALDVPAFAQAKAITAATGTVLPRAYLDFLLWLAEYYFISEPAALLAALPPWLRRAPRVGLAPAPLSHQSIQLPRHRVQILTALVQQLATHTAATTVLYQDHHEVVAVVHGLVKQSAGPVVLICPEVDTAQRWSGWLAQHQPTVVLAKQAASIRLAFHQLLTHQPGVLIGTKRLALLPLTEASRVIVLDPEDPAHKQWDLNPRYQVLRVAEQQHSVICFSQAPRLEQVAQHNIITTLLTRAALPRITTVQPTAGAVLSPALLEAIQQYDRVVLWHNRSGLARYLICQHCHSLNADTTLTACPRCAGQSLRLAGFGTAMLKRWLQAAWPDRQIIEVTPRSPLAPNLAQAIWIGTSAIFARLPWPQIQAAVATSLDAQLAYPDFRSHEYALQQLMRLRNAVPNLYLYSHVPDHPVIQAIQQPYPAKWYQTALAERRRFAYPPDGEYIRVMQRSTGSTRIIRSLAELPTDPSAIIDREC